ncbi:hypothetical protein KI387_011456, partial [Taxus chinensis]
VSSDERRLGQRWEMGSIGMAWEGRAWGSSLWGVRLRPRWGKDQMIQGSMVGKGVEREMELDGGGSGSVEGLSRGAVCEG